MLFRSSEKLGISETPKPNALPDYENLIRFPNLSSIAAARFAADDPKKVDEYWRMLARRVNHQLIQQAPTAIQRQERRSFFKKTKRPFQIQQSDRRLFTTLPNHGKGYNGVMFSSKWLAEDMNLPVGDRATLRQIVDKTHRDQGFKDSSPSDWWVMLLADGDGMGGYVSGQKLEKYADYIPQEIKDDQIGRAHV